MKQAKIAFLGAGNMASCLIESLLQQGYPASCLAASNHDINKLTPFKNKGIHTTTHSASIVDYDIVVLAVKPQHIKSLIEEIKGNLKTTMMISIAAGITLSQIQLWLGNSMGITLCRAMPNTPARYGIGITALFCPPNTLVNTKKQMSSLFEAVGDIVWLEQEAQMDIVTALSGCGPAYFFYFIESLIQGGLQLGLPEAITKQLVLKTAYGAAVMALSASEDLATLRQQVTSKGGTTESGLAVLLKNDLQGIITKTLHAATERGKTLSASYSDDIK